MNYNDVFLRSAILESIPLNDEKYSFPSELSTSVILLRVGYNKKKQEFEDEKQAILKELKKDGFDGRAQAIQQMEDVDKRLKAHEDWNGECEQPAKPSDDEIEKAEETRKTEEDYRKEYAELDKAFTDAINKKSQEEVTLATEKMEYSEFKQLVGAIGTAGTIPVVGIPMLSEMQKQEFLTAVCVNLVKV